MKRKLVQQGTSTLMVSIPKSWADENKLSKGKEVDVTETQEGILISTNSQGSPTKTMLDLKSVDRLKFRLFAILYQQGVDEITIKYEKESQVRTILERVLPELLGMEVVEQSRTELKVRDVGRASVEEYDSILRRLWHILGVLLEDAQKGTSLEHVENVERTVNKLSNYCIRMLHKTKKQPLTANYQLVSSLEDIADELKRRPKESSKSLVDFFRSVEKLYYEYSLADAETVAEQFEKLKKKDDGLVLRSVLGAFNAVVRCNASLF